MLPIKVEVGEINFFFVPLQNQNNQKVHSFYVNPKDFFTQNMFFLVWIH